MVDRLALLKDQGEILSKHAQERGGFFVLDTTRFRTDAERFLAALQARHWRSAIGYSVKTNNLPTMLRAARASGLRAEVVSADELQLARLCGFTGDQIIYNGPVKHPESLRAALDSGVQVHLDSLDELSLAAELALASGAEVAVGLRCHLGNDLTPGSRFGLDLADPETSQAVKRMISAGVVVSGLHCHFPGDRSPEQYARRVQRLATLADAHLASQPLRFVDVGGGMAGPLSEGLRARLRQPRWTYEDYADAIGGEVERLFGSEVELIVEPGTALVAHTAWYVCRIVTRRRVGDREVAVVDGSALHTNPFRTGFKLPAHVVGPTPGDERSHAPVDVVGSTCMEDDLLVSGCTADPRPGDVLLVESCGAYSVSLSSNFITGAPAVFALDVDGTIGDEVRRRASPDDVFASQGGT